MSEKKSLLLVFMGRPIDLEEGAGTKAQKSPFPTLSEVLGIQQSDLGAVHFNGTRLFASDEEPESNEVHGVDGFLTIVSLRTIIRERYPDLEVSALSSSALFEASGSVRAGTPSQPIAIGVSTTFAFAAEEVTRVCRRLRELYPGRPVIVGGAGVTLNPGWLDSSEASYAVLGDAEESFPLLLESIISGTRSPAEIPNLAIRASDGTWAHTQRSQFPIDTITTPRWDLADSGRWPEVVWYESQRGCPFRCTFCSYPNQSLGWILKSPERMADEYQYYVDKGVTSIQCFDSTMVTPPKRMAAFCELLLDRGIKVHWNCYAHAANLKSAELIRSMFAAGCRSVSIGLESCDDTVLRSMKKHVSAAGIRRAIGNCVDAGLMCAVNVIVGFPGETPKTYRQTVESLVELAPDTIGCQAFQVRDRTIPILHMDNFNLEVHDGDQPYWKHDGMDSVKAAQLALEAQWEIAVRADRTIISPVSKAAGVRLAPVDDGEASRFRRQWINPLVNGYGRFLCFEPRFKAMDNLLGRPQHLPERSEGEASRQRDRTLRLWEDAVAASSA